MACIKTKIIMHYNYIIFCKTYNKLIVTCSLTFLDLVNTLNKVDFLFLQKFLRLSKIFTAQPSKILITIY